MTTHRYSVGALRAGTLAIAVMAVLALLLAGCSGDTDDGARAGEPAGSQSAVPEVAADARPAVDAVPYIADQLPAEIAERGALVVGVDLPYEPHAYRDEHGDVTGFDVELATAIGQVLGVTVDLEPGDFAGIFDSVKAGAVDIAIPAFTDTREREKSLDFVTYYSAGNQWARPIGSDIDPGDACGQKVAVKKSTYQDVVEVRAKSEACVAAGEPTIEKVRFDTQDQVVEALMAGEVDAMSADAAVTGIAVTRSNGELEAVDGVFDSAPYGFPVRKGSDLTPVIQQAVQYLMDNGQYEEIAEKWDLEAGTIPSAIINGAHR